eukprot:COSAG02_NODE_1781_length_10947_cov_54.689159_1_plen_92_part_10
MRGSHEVPGQIVPPLVPESRCFWAQTFESGAERLGKGALGPPSPIPPLLSLEGGSCFLWLLERWTAGWGAIRGGGGGGGGAAVDPPRGGGGG